MRVYVNEFPQDDAYVKTEYQDVSNKPSVIVVGEGSGGLFASLKLIELGLRPVVLERGKNVRDRKLDMALITKTQEVDPESNYCFGEGGAGAYSDGKLYTRSKKRGPVDKILNVFCQHGASTSILADAHPHIGTDKLPRVIENMRNTILDCGGEVHFQTKMTSLIIDGNKVVGVKAIDNRNAISVTREFFGPVILATGHSARDVYSYLADANIEMEAKGIAVGVRLEHPSHLIDQIQYHNKNGKGKYLPTAEYSFVTQAQGRGVYSFCMCPGGFVIPSATGPSPLHFWMPSFITKRLQEAFKTFGKQAHGFLTNEAVMIASETRTSSPVRILRNRENLMHIRLEGLFPCAEGAGYAGGIVSAGIDGERCAEMASAYLEQI